MNQTIVCIIAIVCVAGIAALALHYGIDGSVLMSSFTVIGGLGGYHIGRRISRPKPPSSTLPQPHSDNGEHPWK